MNMFRKQFYGLFAIALLAGIVFILNKQGGTVYAADTVVLIENGDCQVEKHTDISEYRKAGGFKAPVFAGEGSEKWIFAGWYTDQACTKALSVSVVSPVKEGSYFAKYVRREVLSVKCQLKEGTKAESADTILRCVSSVDSLKYKNIGLELVVSDGRVKRMQSQNVGTRIQARSDVNLGEYAYSPKAVDVESEYFFSATERIDNADFGKGYVARPYWVTKDGTCVYGVSKYVTVNEGIKREVVHIPVKMDAIPAESAVFGVTDNLGQAVLAKCVAYDEKGGYAHLEISKVPTASATKYTITDDSAKELGTYIYRNVATKYDGKNPDTSWYDVYDEERESKFVIATSADLYGFATLVNRDKSFKDKKVYLVSDIEANVGEAANWEKGTETPAYAWTPIGSKDTKAFEGTFDGQKHIISGIYLKTNVRDSGLFGVIGTNATVKNFSMENSYFETSAKSFGSIAGRLRGTIDTIYSDAIVVSSTENVGGLIGQIYDESGGTAILNNCWFDGTVTKTSEDIKSGIGGLIGSNSKSNSKVENCLFTGTVDASVYNTQESETNQNISPRAGGVVGLINMGSKMEISDSLSTGNIKVHEVATAAYGPVIGYVTSETEAILSNVYASNACNKVYVGEVTGTFTACALGEILGEHAKNKMPALFAGDHWATVENGIPVLKSFSQYGKDVGEISSLHQWFLTTSSPVVTLSASHQLQSKSKTERAQGGYTDGHYFYQAYITETVDDDEDQNKVVILKEDLTGKEASVFSKELPLGHGNDITYNEKTGQLIVCHAKGDKITFMDPNTLEFIETKSLGFNINNIAYNAKRDCYVVGYPQNNPKGNRPFVILDSNFKQIKGPFASNKYTWALVGQGVTCDDEYIYMVLSEDQDISKEPIIAVYDWNGVFVKWIDLKIQSNANNRIEAENISVVDNTVYIMVAEWSQGIFTGTRKAMVYSFTR